VAQCEYPVNSIEENETIERDCAIDRQAKDLADEDEDDIRQVHHP